MAEIPQTLPSIYTQVVQSSEYLKNLVPEGLKAPRFAIICGSGLGGLRETIHAEPRYEISYKDIPNFAHSTAPGHAGKLVFGLLGESKTPVVLMVGRVHFFEGHSIERVTFPVRVFKLLGVETVIVTNAAGGLNKEYKVGDICVLNDHINMPGFSGAHPLRGPNVDEFGPRFPPLSDAYDLKLRKAAHLAYKKLKLSNPNRKLREGIYAFVSGPSYETRAECRFLLALGADVVGMSTVPEIIVARHCGLRVMAMSLVTNEAIVEPVPRGDSELVQNTAEDKLNDIIEAGKANHEEVLEAGALAATDMQALVKQLVDDLVQ
ncbi:purine nucleoside phosphorylase I, inosine and guanosine-specific [Ascobolus immersus RN42]|uniref:Purine nucleoside phosphorylase n=1 Tax=Ascobolus immersus RN42 TaxID=1160509 RepID=A0A3N4IQZ4_ASCIM|nr:purine nucleoside phosphorylase I, inosine and guanosine-specific [Ascobolus immersus RN42]